MLKFILPLVPSKFGTYFEPFFGGGALFFALQPSKAVLADKNPDLISAYQEVRDNPDTVIRILKRLTNSKESYYSVRAWVPESDCGRAARLIYLSTLAFNGIYRENLKGQFNVPYGFKGHLEPCETGKIRNAGKLLKKATIKCEDFETTVESAQPGDVVYFDPPYTTAHTNNGFVKYNAKIFTWQDQRRLSEVARDLVCRGCAVLVSNADHPSIHELYRDFSAKRIPRYSVIAASSSFRQPTTECLFYRGIPPADNSARARPTPTSPSRMADA